MSDTTTNGTAPAPKKTPAQRWADILAEPTRMAVLKRLETKWLSAERAVQMFCTDVLMKSPEVATSTPASVLKALCTCVATGLEPGLYVHFTTFMVKNPEDETKKIRVVQAIVDYKGLVRVMYRSPLVKSVLSFAVFEGDQFDVSLGSNVQIKHIPNLKAVRTIETLTYVYAVVTLVNGGVVPHIMDKEEVRAIRARSRAADAGPWVTDPVEMARKCPLRNVGKYLPVEEYELSRAIAHLDPDVVFDADPSPPLNIPADANGGGQPALPATRQDAFADRLNVQARQQAVETPAQAQGRQQAQPGPIAAAMAQGAANKPQPKPAPRPVKAHEEINEEDIPF